MNKANHQAEQMRIARIAAANNMDFMAAETVAEIDRLARWENDAIVKYKCGLITFEEALKLARTGNII